MFYLVLIFGFEERENNIICDVIDSVFGRSMIII